MSINWNVRNYFYKFSINTTKWTIFVFFKVFFSVQTGSQFLIFLKSFKSSNWQRLKTWRNINKSFLFDILLYEKSMLKIRLWPFTLFHWPSLMDEWSLKLTHSLLKRVKHPLDGRFKVQTSFWKSNNIDHNCKINFI